MKFLGDPDEGPKSKLACYAYGYSDEKPGAVFWLIYAAMIAFVVWAAFR